VLRSLWRSIITIVVGEKKDKVVIYKAILVESSKFFKKAVKPEWSSLRPDPDSIELEHMDLDTFKLYVHWVYFGAIKLPEEDVDGVYTALAKAYVLGEELMDVKFKNDTLDTIIDVLWKSDDWPFGEPVAIIYNGTIEKSPARRLMVDICACYVSIHSNRTREFKNCPKDFLLDAMTALAEGECNWKQLGSKSLYHEDEQLNA
jgi:hypothetical protein